MPRSSNKIGFWASTSLVVGNMTGSGIFLVPAAIAFFGGISFFGWLMTTTGAIFLALVFARLSKIVSTAGGPYAYTRESLGNFPGFLVTWGYWISIWCGNAAIAVASVGYLSYLFPVLKDNRIASAVLSIAAIWFFTLINTRNIKSVGLVQLITTIIKILPLILLGSLGFLYFNPEHFSPLNISGLSNLEAISSSAALTLWAFLGLESATIPSDQVHQPKKTIPRATMAGIVIAALLYISSNAAIMGIIDPKVLQYSAAPFADAAEIAWGSMAARLIAVGAVISCYGALNGWILMQGQLPMAAARDRLFPKAFMKTSKTGIPIAGLLIASTLASVLVFMNFTKGLIPMFSFIIMLSTLTCLLPYLFSSVSELFLYFRGKIAYTRRRLIASILISTPAFIYSLWAIAGLGLEIIGWGALLLVLGIPFYFVAKKVGSKN